MVAGLKGIREAPVGDILGIAEGFIVGIVGAMDGTMLGVVGFVVGKEVGAVGLNEALGTREGALVGDKVGGGGSTTFLRLPLISAQYTLFPFWSTKVRVRVLPSAWNIAKDPMFDKPNFTLLCAGTAPVAATGSYLPPAAPASMKCIPFTLMCCKGESKGNNQDVS